MTLGQFSVLVGTRKRWVQNAFQALGLPPTYTVQVARRLAFARALKEAAGMPLRHGYQLADDALIGWPTRDTWQLIDSDGTVRLTMDLERFLVRCSVRLSLARTRYAERRRGRPPKRTLRGLELAKWYGVDVSLLRASLELTQTRRFRRLEEASAFFRAARVMR